VIFRPWSNKGPPVPPADEKRLGGWVDYLARVIGPRPYTKPHVLRKIADRLAEEFRALGYTVFEQSFSYKGETFCNVGASSPQESGRRSVPLVVVGAHYDTVSWSPGADDNASGVAGLMEMARLLSEAPPPGVRLVAFALEEPPVFRSRHMGSYVYARSLQRKGVRLKGMICLEMIGYFSDRPGSQSFPLFFMEKFYPDTGNFIALVGNRKSAGWTEEVKKSFSQGTDLPVESLNAPWIVPGMDFSDHWSFNRLGYPAVMVTDTAFYRNPHYHRTSDTPGTLDFRRAAKVVDGLAWAVRCLA
jgi:Zn-dependent M28 family amino/carboxypeptidase